MWNEGYHVSRSQANKFSSSFPSGKESDNEDFLNSGSVSTVLFDAPNLTDPEKSLTSTPITASPINDEFNVNIHEEVVFSPSLMPSLLENIACGGFMLQMPKLKFLKRFFFCVWTGFSDVPYPFGQHSFLVKATEEFHLSLVRFVFLNHQMDQETANSCICPEKGKVV